MMEPVAVWNPFDVLLERDSNRNERADLAFGDRAHTTTPSLASSKSNLSHRSSPSETDKRTRGPRHTVWLTRGRLQWSRSTRAWTSRTLPVYGSPG